jgi:hypothetical protein
MADITDPQVVKWANERSRVIADGIERLRYAVQAYQADYVAQGIGAKIIAAGVGSVVADGSAIDGRSIITGTSLVNLNAAISKLVTNLTVDLVAGVGVSVAGIADGIQVNGTPR